MNAKTPQATKYASTPSKAVKGAKTKLSVQNLGLSSAGHRVFQLLYALMMENPKKDTVYFHFSAASQLMSLAIFKEGLADLLAKEVIFRSTQDFTYFVNVNYMIGK